MEYLEKLKNKQNFNSRLNPEIITDIERLAELHFDITGEEIVSDKMLLETALDNALSKRKPVEVSKKQDLERIDFLEKEGSTANLVEYVNLAQWILQKIFST